MHTTPHRNPPIPHARLFPHPPQSLHKSHISAQKNTLQRRSFHIAVSKTTPWYPDPPLSSTGPLSHPSIPSNRYIPLHAQRAVHPPPRPDKTRPEHHQSPSSPAQKPRSNAANAMLTQGPHSTQPSSSPHRPQNAFCRKRNSNIKRIYTRWAKQASNVYIRCLQRSSIHSIA